MSDSDKGQTAFTGNVKMPENVSPGSGWLLKGLLLFSLLASSLAGTAELSAAPGDDDYALGVTLYGQKRWELAGQTLAGYLQKYPDHAQAALAKMYLAQCYVNQQKYSEAREVLRGFLKAHPENKNLTQAMYRVAECSYFLDDYPAAIEEFNTFLKTSPMDPLREWAWPYLADAYLRDQQSAEAIKAFQQSLEQFPEGRFVEDSRFGLARAYELQNQPEAAIEQYQQLLDQPGGKRIPEALVNLGMLYFQQQKYENAAEVFSSLVEKYPEHTLVPMAELNTGYAHYSLKQWDEALQHFRLAARFPTYAATAHYWVAQTYRGQGSWGEAEKVLVQLQEENPPAEMLPRIVFQLADSQFRQQRYAEAGQSFRSYLQQWPTGDQAETAWLQAIESLQLQGYSGQAWKLAQQTQGFAFSPQGKLELGMLLSRILLAEENAADPFPANLQARPARLERIATLLQELINQDTAPPATLLAQQVRVQAAQIQQELKNFPKVVELLEPLTTKRAEDVTLLIPEVWLLQATALFESGEYELALDSTEELLKKPELNSTVMEQLRLLRLNSLLKTTRFAEAETELQEYLGLESPADKRIQATFQLAEACYSGRDWERAARLYERVLAENPAAEWRMKAMSALGWTQFEAGEFEQASQTFSQLQAAFPDSRQAAADAGYMRGMAELRASRQERAADIFSENAVKFRTPADQPEGDEVGHVAYRSAREAARVYRRLGEQEPAAAAYKIAYEELTKQPDPRNASLDKLLDEWALLHYEADQFEQADAVFRILIEQTPDSDRADDARLSLAESQYISGNVKQAEQMLTELLALPNADDYVKRRARYQLVLIAVAQKNYPQIKTQAEAYLAENDSTKVDLSEWGEVESHLIQCDLQAEQLAAAGKKIEALFEKAEQSGKRQELNWLPALYVQAAELARREKNYERSRQLLQEIQEQFAQSPEREQVEVIVGRTHIAEADFENANRQFQGVVERSKGEKTLAAAQAQFYLAETALIKKDYDTALKEYIRVAVLFPGFPDLQTAAYYQAGQCDEVLGNVDQAIQSYESLVRFFPDSEFAGRAKQRISKLRGGN